MRPGTTGLGGRGAGYTLLEIVVALTVLSIGSSILWYTLRSSTRLDRMNRLHHAANLAARSDLESLRAAHKSALRDTSYKVLGPGGEELLLAREVFDSADIAESSDELILDANLSPLELRKPREVRVRVFMAVRDGDDGTGFGGSFGNWDDDWTSADSSSRRTLATLLLKIPEYRWY